MIKVMFVIRKLDIGGAERQLIELIKVLDKAKYAVTVLTFYPGGKLEHELAGLDNVELRCLEKKGRWDALAFVLRFFKGVRACKPDIIHGYLPVANELSLFARMTRARIVWGLRSSDIDTTLYDWSATAMFHIGALLSRHADLIVLNSNAGVSHFSKHGYCRARMKVIPNGIDTARFSPDPEMRRTARTELGIDETQRLVGRVARMDPVKDTPTFLRAAAIVAARRSDVRFIYVGDGREETVQEMQTLALSLGLSGRLKWLGARKDTSRLYNAMDLAVSCSLSEGFPNVVAEAMACGVPCVASDVGDTAFLMGGIGAVVPKGDPEALAAAIMKCLDQQTDSTRDSARRRIVNNFSLKRLQVSTEHAFEALCS